MTPSPKLSNRLADNETEVWKLFSDCSDLIVRRLAIYQSVPCLVVYLDSLVDKSMWEGGILTPLMDADPGQAGSGPLLFDHMMMHLSSVVQPITLETMADVANHIVKGDIVLFIEAQSRAACFQLGMQIHRQLEEPSSEAVIRGPRIGFIEDLHTNLTLLRQRIRTPQLKVEQRTVGTKSQTDLAIVYLKDAAPMSVVEEVRKRVSKVDMDSVLGSGYVEELISDHPNSPFPVIHSTQRPDAVSGSLIEGKVAVLVNGTPNALIMPFVLWSGFQTVEDYYMNFIFATLLRWLRYLFGYIALMMPAFYVATTTFHQEMIPTSLTLSLAAAREVVPFPTMVETLVMEITFEALREAGVRLPRPVGQTISIVGALVIGQAAVQAGIISAPIIIVVSLTGIASFLIPNTSMSQAVSIFRFPMVLLAGMFGLYGVSAGLLAMLIHLTTLHSFGVPYLSPLTPLQPAGLTDVLFRAPWSAMRKRQQSIRKQLELINQ